MKIRLLLLVHIVAAGGAADMAHGEIDNGVDTRTDTMAKNIVTTQAEIDTKMLEGR